MNFREPPFTTRITSLLAILGLSILILSSVTKTKQQEQIRPTIGLKAASAFQLYRQSVNPTPTLQPIASRISIPKPSIFAQSYLVQLIGDAHPLLEQESNKQMRPASITKILTSLIGIEELDLQTKIVFSKDAKRVGEKISSISAGERLVRDDAIRVALMESDNDAAQAIAEIIGRNKGAFSFNDAMEVFKTTANQKARSIGLTQSHFENPTGLDDDNHYTTAHDLFRLAEYIWNQYPELWEFSREIDMDVHSVENNIYHISTTNQLLSEFPGLIGGKTGLTDIAKGTLILLYPARPNRIAVVVILGSENRFEDGRQLIHWLDQTFQ